MISGSSHLMISKKLAYYHVIVLCVNLKRKHGLVFNCLKSKFVLVLKLNKNGKEPSHLDSIHTQWTYLWQKVHIFAAVR